MTWRAPAMLTKYSQILTSGILITDVSVRISIWFPSEWCFETSECSTWHDSWSAVSATVWQLGEKRMKLVFILWIQNMNSTYMGFSKFSSEILWLDMYAIASASWILGGTSFFWCISNRFGCSSNFVWPLNGSFWK